MYKYRFHNYPVFSDIQLLEQNDDPMILRATEHPVKLIAGSLVEQESQAVPIIVPQIISHGRKVVLSIDRSLSEGFQGSDWRFEVEGVVRFGGSGGDGLVVYDPLELATDELIGFWFIHQLLPIYLTFMKGYHFFHAGSVEVKGGAVVFLAPSKGGKSTITEYFLSKAHGLISDDKLAIAEVDGRYITFTAHSRYRPYRRNEDLGSRAARIGSSPLPVRAIFTLNPVGPVQPVRMQRIVGSEKFNTLLASRLYLVKGTGASDLKFLGGMAELAPIHRLDVPRSKTRLEEVYQAIMGLLETH